MPLWFVVGAEEEKLVFESYHWWEPVPAWRHFSQGSRGGWVMLPVILITIAMLFKVFIFKP